MKKPGLFLAVTLGLLLAVPSLFAQRQILTLDTGAPGSWSVGVQPGTTNQLLLSDYPDEYSEGVGSMKVEAYIRGFAASWGTWTDAQWTFASPLDLSAYDDIRFDMKITTPPSHAGAHISDNRNLQFVLDLYDSVYYNNAGSIVLWRYAAGTGDLNIFYYPHDKWISPTLTGWFEVVIPIQALRYPNWWGTIGDGTWHGNHILRLGFGVDGDSSAADSITFLIDNIRATKKQSVIQAQSMDGPAADWVIGTQPGANIKAVVADHPDDYMEGTGSMLVDVAIRTQAAGWGSWTDFTYNYPTPLNATTATELRFSYKTVTPTTTWKRLQFVVDLYDSRGGPWRWANAFGQFGLWAAGLENNYQNTWTEVAIPLNDLTVPGWASADTYLHLDSLMSLHFGVDADSSGADSVKFLLDHFYFTKLGAPDAVEENVTGEIPQSFRLEQNYPNPFNPSTTIQFSVVTAGKVSLTVYNVAGQLVGTVLEGVEHAPGTYRVNLDMSRNATGAYFYVLQQGTKREAKLMMLVK
ncbi:MAG: T9SS type A sorting domain-containing protein [Bacteroidota bacterium]